VNPLEAPASTGASFRQRSVALLTALGFALAEYLLFGDALPASADEGYLWYGVWRTGLGELPLRDFQSYEPGRYVACAALGEVLGSGLLGLRRAQASFVAVGIFLGLLCASRTTRKAWPLVPIGLVLGLWIFPRHKVFEGALSLASTWIGVRLLERPTRARHLAAGACAGLCAFFGRNHGLYALLGFIVLMAVSAWKRRERDWPSLLGRFAGGVSLGYSPMLGLFLFAPGFWDGFARSMRILLRLGTNLEAPWLWPWDVRLVGVPAPDVALRLGLILAYLLPLILLPLGVLALLRARAPELPKMALLGASAVLGAFYIHHAAVRSDLTHLAQSIQPTLLAGVALLAPFCRRQRRLGPALALVLATFLLLPVSSEAERGELVPARLGQETVRVRPEQAEYYAHLTRILEQHVRPEDAIFFAPARPAFYPLFQKRSPSWWIYFFVPDPGRDEQDALVAELAEVEWVLIVDQTIAGREDLRFERTNPPAMAFLRANFARVPTPELKENHALYRRR
jgi:hypothetical protein